MRMCMKCCICGKLLTSYSCTALAFVDMKLLTSRYQHPTGCAGADALKDSLAKLGLKCGGTLRQRAERLMLTKTTPLDKLDRKLFAKGVIPAVSDECPVFVPGSKYCMHCAGCLFHLLTMRLKLMPMSLLLQPLLTCWSWMAPGNQSWQCQTRIV